MAKTSSANTDSQATAIQQPLLLEPDFPLDQSQHPALQNNGRDSYNNPPTPLPLKQIFVLCLMRLTEPISFTVIFPFINKMIEDLNIVPRTQVGTYAGVIESLFALSQFSTVLFWGRLSDRIGRKPVLLTGLMGLSIGIILFGLQRTFVGLVIARSFAGAMNGNIAVVKSSMAEITDESNKARAFPLLPLCWAIGLMIGPAIGGYTAEPAKQYPHSIFARHPFFSTYPYFVPCLLAGLFNILAVVLGTLYLEETLPSKVLKAQKRSAEVSHDDSLEDQERPDPAERARTLKELLTSDLVTLLISFGFMALENSAWMAIVPLFSYTRVEDGGLGLTLDQIGLTLSSNGVVALVVQSILFPILHRRLGVVHLHRISRFSSPIAFVGLPMVRTISLLFPDKSKATSVAIIGMIVIIAIKSVGNMTIVCMTLLINDSAPNRASLGSINGLGQSVSSFSRAISPFLVGKLFSISLAAGKSPENSAIQKDLIWYYLIIVALIGYSTTWMIKPVQKEPIRNPEREPLLDSEDASTSRLPGRGEEQRLITDAGSRPHYGT
ncbi:hypothetical protein PGT21_006921 [Puccinia graminis f. sp. tritici]|uniref:Major facilitator superfamily (MFS) profile domain-containing protein n=2 Tax=Puccinia graminis f. sp. tritici TaxID=56615 RepID=E3L5M9_PUCGT|nr:uncharacterized protein PGTG_18048 [Puccinia graminis f. sp. tritici CRL 75-36-700-3]EFP91854.2 hypothetical protein PGTG_18048 [Puccinia graminis f. sp. tritici CRL 75-36-700-3]KAA1073268.1 hypothetical protein PGT21_006921 [Puccinia graminis f. sp. tritici]KAA1132863.1 hypothetical protein PGTUg99_015337 [Puccinia graminis f. sp. tritici]